MAFFNYEVNETFSIIDEIEFRTLPRILVSERFGHYDWNNAIDNWFEARINKMITIAQLKFLGLGCATKKQLVYLDIKLNVFFTNQHMTEQKTKF